MAKNNDFNEEINELYKYLVDKKYNDEEIRRIFAPILKKQNKIDKIVRNFVISAVILTLSYFLTYNDRFSWNMSAIGRILMIKMLPLYDWTRLDGNCLLKYPEPPQKIDFNCGMCEYLADAGREFQNITPDVLLENYLEVHRPVIIENGLSMWNLDDKFIDDIYGEDVIYDSMPCMMASSIQGEAKISVGNLIEKARKFGNFFMHFQNCGYEAMRVFRKHSFAPEFLPEVLSPILYNWLLWNRDFNTTKFKAIDLMEKNTLIGQVYGETEFRLLPRKNCENYCNTLNITLKRGESLLLTSLWNLEYKPVSTGENIAVILEIKG